ncbi:MAG: MMPL family transporter [Flavobacteriales bacterium]|nr:MMPL family transporter [Flavobacteriales bacterium]
MVISIVLVAISLSGIHGIKINNHFLDDIAQESPLKKDLLYFENNFSGIRPFEMGIDLVDSNNSIFQRDVLIEMEIVERYLQDEYGVGALVSPLTIVKSANRAIHGGRNRFYTLPDSEKGLAEVMKLLKKNKKLREYKMLVNENRARISGKMKDLGSLEVAERNLSLATYLAENTALATFHITGAAQLMDNSNANIALNLTRGLGIALAFTAVILGLLFSSLRIALLSLIPNAFPLILIGGMMGWFGVDLKVATALIFPIAFGIAVDDTIHLLSRLRIELEYGASWEEAIRNSILKTGKAILITTLILSSGFGVFMFSEFQSTYYIGLLVGMALIFAVLADLFLLPILLGTKK